MFYTSWVINRTNQGDGVTIVCNRVAADCTSDTPAKLRGDIGDNPAAALYLAHLGIAEVTNGLFAKAQLGLMVLFHDNCFKR